jgi:hypothetical protein
LRNPAILLPLLLLLGWLAPTPAFAVTETWLTYGIGENFAPSTHSGRVTWMGVKDSNWQIYLWDGGQRSQITSVTGTADAVGPDISDDYVAYHIKDGSSFVVYAYRLSDGVTLELSNPQHQAFGARVVGKRIVWIEKEHADAQSEIMLWDDGVLTQLTDNDTDDIEPRLDATSVIWTCYDGPGREICLWDGNTTTQLTHNTRADWAPTVHGGLASWRCTVASGWDVCAWNGTTSVVLTQTTYNETLPTTSAMGVVWGELNGTGSRVLVWDGTTTSTVATGGAATWTTTSDEVIWWQGGANGVTTPDLYYWDGSAVQSFAAKFAYFSDNAPTDGRQIVIGGFSDMYLIDLDAKRLPALHPAMLGLLGFGLALVGVMSSPRRASVH